MLWKQAVDACEIGWEKFVEEYEKEIERRIELAKNSFVNTHISSLTPEVAVEDLLKCRENFRQIWPRWKERALKRLQDDLLKPGSKSARVGKVSSRKPIKAIFSKPRARKKPGPKPKAKNRHKRKHVRTGRPRGWNNASFVKPSQRAGIRLSKRERERRAAQRRRERGRVERIARRARWSKSLGRFWKPYPKR